MKKSKDDWIQCQCKYIDDNIRHRIHNKWAYETLRTLTNTTPISISIIEDINDIPLAEDIMILKRLTEYYNDLYNRHINPDISVLNSNANFNTYIEEQLPKLESAVIEVIKILKEGKSPGIDNIPSELATFLHLFSMYVLH